MSKVELISLTPDAEKTMAYIARVSNPKNQENEDYSKLLSYCIKNEHWSVFEQSFMTLQIETNRGIAAQIFEKLSEASINVDLIIQSTNNGNNNDITFTVSELEVKKTAEQCELITSQLGGEYNLKTNMTKLSIQGAGIMGRPSVSADLFDTLSQANINVRYKTINFYCHSCFQ